MWKFRRQDWVMGRVQATGDGLASEENLKDISISVFHIFISSYASEKNICTSI